MICKTYVKCLKVLEIEWPIGFPIWEKNMSRPFNDFGLNVSYFLACKMFLQF